mmetsp:Transcript_6564/g.21888  ORF Transcript_6564/g.21888 Transcript_6564/m.21888 type:complete len:194 (+) Transcript_6564:804-1385(+)
MLDQSSNKIERSPHFSSAPNLLSIFFYLGLGFLSGILVCHFDSSMKDPAESSSGGAELLNAQFFSEQNERKPIVEKSNLGEIMSLGSNEYSCNTVGAFDELTQLHQRSVALDERRAKGEANRARSATIQRKTGNAHVAESTFRMCVQKLIPELLSAWDERAKRKDLVYHHTEAGEVDLDVLKQTADAFEELGE